MKIFMKKAISTVEFSLLFVVSVVAFVGIQPLLKRSLAGGWRAQIDQIGAQFSPTHQTITTTYIETSNQVYKQSNGADAAETRQHFEMVSDEEIGSFDSPEMRIKIN